MGRDHPRSRGKDFCPSSLLGLDMGSPPLARERLPCKSDLAGRLRITPARAGKTPLQAMNAAEYQDHPRSRGKDIYHRPVFHFLCGSPPLARERHPVLYSPLDKTGITPARAGKTYLLLSVAASTGDHPRSRGKDCCPIMEGRCTLGSPPLARERPSGL